MANNQVRVLSPEEIAARAGGETPFFHWPSRDTLFAERSMRLRQLSGGHAMEPFLGFMADLAQAQHDCLQHMSGVPLPDDQAIDAAARQGQPALPASDWPRDPAWQTTLRALATALLAKAPEHTHPVLHQLVQAPADVLEQQADCLLTGVTVGLDMAAAPLVSAALQVYWTHMVLEVQRLHGAKGQPFGRIDDETVCPCCGSLPTVSITRSSGESLGQRYLSCSLCSMQWHMVRIKCAHCLSAKSLAYHALENEAETEDEGSRRVAHAVIQAETCDDCGHYLKIMHTDRDAFVEPVADDLASITLDLLLADSGRQRHGVNLMLLFGEPEPPPHSGPA